MKTYEMHKKDAPKKLKFAVITISDSKYLNFCRKENIEDKSGETIISKLREKQHEIVFYTVVPDQPEMICGIIEYVIDRFSPDVIVTTGGTGVSYYDVTIETLKNLFDKEIDGFGELFRKLSFEQIGTSALLSRATAGVYCGVVIFSLPGSPQAVEMGIGIILEEAPHIAKHAREGYANL